MQLEQMKQALNSNVGMSSGANSNPFGNIMGGLSNSGIAQGVLTTTYPPGHTLSPGAYAIGKSAMRSGWDPSGVDEKGVLYTHTSHAPESINKTLETFGWFRHYNGGPELFTHKDHPGACLYWHEAMAVQLSLAFVELNKP
jgi:hypothetical protein